MCKHIQKTIEVIGVDMNVFHADAETLEPLCCGSYEPAAWRDPRGPAIGVNEWNRRLSEKRVGVKHAWNCSLNNGGPRCTCKREAGFIPRRAR